MAGRSYHLRIAPASDSIRSSELKASTRSASQRRRNASRPAPIDETNGNENEEGRAHTDIYQRNHSERRTRNCRRKPPPGSGKKKPSPGGKTPERRLLDSAVLGRWVGFVYLYKAQSLDFFCFLEPGIFPRGRWGELFDSSRGGASSSSHFSFPGRGGGGKGRTAGGLYLKPAHERITTNQ